MLTTGAHDNTGVPVLLVGQNLLETCDITLKMSKCSRKLLQIQYVSQTSQNMHVTSKHSVYTVSPHSSRMEIHTQVRCLYTVCPGCCRGAFRVAEAQHGTVDEQLL